ncbi:hypothetical protein EG68_09080 [Paragonimus skrjabini miyazakii]|uniref:ubiquitinyl hydrolase 1 n=1 Tax=Paragonimus skrjabini miyazakii TaxID=59628 RepID=A0A8S9YD64_9TREM|nr:hypothetical protein EG68_09080 [Paragonimus skrjabini miyazakii]
MCQAEWHELESDPGLFTLLLEDFGVGGVQVEEVYDLSKPINETVYGFIFLFRWDRSKRKSSRRTGRGSSGSTTSLVNTNVTSAPVGNQPAPDPLRLTTNNPKISTSSQSRLTSGLVSEGRAVLETDNFNQVAQPDSTDPHISNGGVAGELFFARQTVQNSCATHALLSVLLNRPELDLGHMLNEFHRATRNLSPEAKGMAIGSMPQLAQAHNKHATRSISSIVNPAQSTGLMPEPSEAAAAAVSAALASTQGVSNPVPAVESSVSLTSSTTSNSSVAQPDTFHFVSYVPFGGFLYELDGLKPDPINHGPLRNPVNEWDWTEQCTDILRQRMQEQDVRYCLMAVVPDRRLHLTKRMCTLNTNLKTIKEIILQKARFEAKRRHGSFHSSLVNGNMDLQNKSPTAYSEFGLQSGFDSKTVKRARSISKQEPSDSMLDTASDALESCEHSNRERSLGIDNGRPIQTRSVTRSAATVPLKPIELDRTSSDTEQPVQSSVHVTSNQPTPLIHGQDSTRKRFLLHPSLESDETAVDGDDWVCDRKRRLIETNSPVPDPDCSPQFSSQLKPPSDRMNKFLASIVSTESPLLTTLTETVAAEAQACAFELKQEQERQITCTQSDLPLQEHNQKKELSDSTSSVLCRYSTGEDLPSAELCTGNLTKATMGNCGFKRDACSPVSLDTKHSNECCSHSLNVLRLSAVRSRRSFAATFTTQHRAFAAEVTKPLTVDTELWHNTAVDSARVPNHSQAVGDLDLHKKMLSPEANESRPQTRALTRARVKHSPSNANRPSNSAQPPATSVISNGLLHPFIKSSPAAYSPFLPHSPNSCCSSSWLDNSERKSGSSLLTSERDAELSTTDCPPSNCASTSDPALTDSMTAASRAYKYPTRSSTKRDTLASHNLAQCRAITPLTSNTTTHYPNSQSVYEVVEEGVTATQLSALHDVGDTYNSSPGRTEINSSAHGFSEIQSRQLTVGELQFLMTRIKEQIKLCTDSLAEEEKKRQMYRLDDSRRVHNYEPFIRAYLLALVKNGMLQNLVLSTLQTTTVGSNSTQNTIVNPSASSTRLQKSTPNSDRSNAARRTYIDRIADTLSCTSPPNAASSHRHLSSESRKVLPASSPTRLRARTRLSSSIPSNSDTQPDNSADLSDMFTSPVVSSNSIADSHAPDSPIKSSPLIATNNSVPINTISDRQSCFLSRLNASVDDSTEKLSDTDYNSKKFENHCSGTMLSEVNPPVSTESHKDPIEYSDSTTVTIISDSPVISSTTGASYSSCGSASLSPQSSTSSRSVAYLRPRPSVCRSQPTSEGNISRKSLRPRVSSEQTGNKHRSVTENCKSTITPTSVTHNRSSVKQKNAYCFVESVESGNKCKSGSGSGPFPSLFCQRMRRRRLC